jgi:hypothetical protein
LATITENILEQFYLKLEQTGGFHKARVQQLRDLFAKTKKPKATDLMAAFSESASEKLP